jgi:hypothetical protein
MVDRVDRIVVARSLGGVEYDVRGYPLRRTKGSGSVASEAPRVALRLLEGFELACDGHPVQLRPGASGWSHSSRFRAGL